MRPDELERRLQAHLDALAPARRADLLHVLMLPDFERADRIGEFWSYAQSRTFAELLMLALAARADLLEDNAHVAVGGNREVTMLPHRDGRSIGSG